MLPKWLSEMALTSVALSSLAVTDVRNALQLLLIRKTTATPRLLIP